MLKKNSHFFLCVIKNCFYLCSPDSGKAKERFLRWRFWEEKLKKAFKFYEKLFQIIFKNICTKQKHLLLLHSQFRTTTTEVCFENKAKRTRDHWHTNNNQKSKEKLKRQITLFESYKGYKHYNGEFDPGSGWTLAGGLTHASRAVFLLRKRESGVRVRNTCATCLYLGNSLPKGRLIPHNILSGII